MNRKVLHIILLTYSVIISIFLCLQIKQDIELQKEHHYLETMLEEYNSKDSIFLENYYLRNYTSILDNFYLIGKSKKEIERFFSIDSICYLQEIDNNDEQFNCILNEQKPPITIPNYSAILKLQGFNTYFLFYNDSLYRKIDESGVDYSFYNDYYIKYHKVFFDGD